MERFSGIVDTPYYAAVEMLRDIFKGYGYLREEKEEGFPPELVFSLKAYLKKEKLKIADVVFRMKSKTLLAKLDEERLEPEIIGRIDLLIEKDNPYDAEFEEDDFMSNLDEQLDASAEAAERMLDRE